MSDVVLEPAVNASIGPWLSFGSSRLSHLRGVGSLSGASIRNDSRLKLDQELEGLQQTMVAIRSRRNSLSPISRLPSELLAEVFSYLSAEEIPGVRSSLGLRVPRFDPSMSDSSPLLGWIRVTHVCQTWRTVAFDNPRLWGIDIHSLPSWTTERLRRSRQAPLNIRLTCVEGQKPEETSLIESLLSETHRATEINLSTLGNHVVEHMFPLLMVRAPLLETFVYSALSSVGSSGADDSMLPSRLFAQSAPHLRRLELTNTILPFESPLYENLTQLTMKSYGPDGSAPFSGTQLLSLLHRIPRLETLDLSNIVPLALADAHPQGSQAPVTLHSLRTLRLFAESANCLWLMERLRISPAATIQLECDEGHRNDNLRIRNAFVPIISRHSSGQETSAPLQSAQIYLRQGCLAFVGWTSIHTEQSTVAMNHSLVEGTHAPIAVRFLGDHYSHARAKFRETLGLLLASLNKVHIKVLHFQLDAKELSRSDWLNLFGAFTAVETVSVSGMAVCPFMDALDPRLPADAEHREGPPAGAGRVLFPNLRCIKLHLVPFLTAAVDDDVLVSRRVETSVRNRRRVNTQLEEIELRDCRVTQGIVDNLRDAVPRVMWDGVSATLCSMGDYGPYSSNWMPGEEDMYDSDDGWAWDEHDEWIDDSLGSHVPAGFYGDLVAVTDPLDLPDPLELEFDQY